MRLGSGVVVLAVTASCATTGARARTKAQPPPAPVAVAPAPPKPIQPPRAPASAAQASPTLPETRAGKTLGAWLDAFDSADEARMRAFVSAYTYPGTVDQMVAFHEQTGGFDLLGVEKSEPLAIEFLVKEKASSTQAVGWLKVKDADPAEIESFTLLAIPPGMTAADMDIKVDAATRARVIDAIAARLNEFYVYPDLAKKMVRALREHQHKGEYDAITDGPSLAERLTDQLQAVSHDKHLRVNFVPMVVPQGDHEPTAADKARMRAQLDHIHCGFDKVEKLDGNIGYVKFDMFADPEICGAKVTAALASLAGVDALIFDLRDNGGGQPKMVAFIASYLFGKRTHLNDLYDRKENKTTQFWTQPDVPGPRFLKQPVYVLTSRRTFSGAEEFCYDLQNLKRATIVGETTGGGAHPTAPKRLDDHFIIAVPFARAINPITKTDWEGKGIAPDVKVPADQALETATKLAAGAIHLHGGPSASTAKVDLELADTTLTGALAALAGKAQINVFTDSHIDDAGRVTLTVHSAPWQDVLARLASEHHLRVETLEVRGSDRPSFWISKQSSPPAPVTSFNGARITARFDETPIRDVAKALSAVAKRRIVVDDGVQVNITLHLRLPWDLALYHLAQKYDLRILQGAGEIRISRP